MNSFIPKALPVIVDSLHADFELNTWTVKLRDPFEAVSGGLYLCVPITDADEAEILIKAIEAARTPTPVTKRGRPPKITTTPTTGTMTTGPQPGDLDYDGPPPTSTGKS